MLVQEQRHASFALTAEGTTYLQSGSPEAQVFSAIGAEGIPQPELIVSHCSCTLILTGVPAGQRSGHSKTSHKVCAAAKAWQCWQRGYGPGHEVEMDHS